MSPRYQYLPWVREGAAHAYDNPDSLAKVLARSGGKPLSVVPVSLRVNDKTKVDVPLRLFGAGDVTGIDPRIVLRTDPLARTADFEPNYLACIEFDNPDLPWLFTPAASGTNGRLRPWLVLVVVKRDAVTVRPTRERRSAELDTPVVELPDLAESWAWVHAQVLQMDASQSVEQILSSAPDQNLSRLVAPRRLEPETRYLACVVPAFEAGRKAGLGLDVTAADEVRLAPAWDGSQPRVQLPIYYHWEFATGKGGDFETLARRLEPRVATADTGRRALRVHAQPFGLPDVGVLQLEGALVPPGPFTRPSVPPAFRSELRNLLNLSAVQPVVTPPIYGGWQSAQAVVPPDGARPAWLNELNLDPSARAVAGMGVRVVQARQEQLVAAAWEQLGDAPAVVQLERRLDLAVQVLHSVVRRRLEPMDAGSLVQFLGPAATRIRMSPETLHASLARQGLPPAFSTASFRRVIRAGGPSARRTFPGAQPSLQHLATRLGSAVPAVEPAANAPGHVSPAVLSSHVEKLSFSTIGQFFRYRTAAMALRSYANAFAPRFAAAQRPAFGLTATFSASMVANLNPQTTAPPRFYARLTGSRGSVQPPAGPGQSVLFAPSFPQPMYEPLRDLSAELLLPGVGQIELDTVTVLNSNPRFIEAYMVGLTHELGSELLWREFPNDTRATYFRTFWDTRGTPNPISQLPPINQWDPSAALGGSFAGGGSHVVLLIRGELLLRYPDALIYAVRAKTVTSLGAEEKLPIFRGRIDPDITFLGFDLTETAARGAGNDPGWFFVIQEQPTAPRFGFDDTRSGPLGTWNDLAWTDVAAEPGTHVKVASVKPVVASPLGVTWGFNSAHLAAILRQRPVRIAIHARRLLPAAAGPRVPAQPRIGVGPVIRG